jgi:prepilin-type N-terminal cleavage/methylation domain-containing protein
MLEGTHMTLSSRQLKIKKGFTLIELMVVVSIIGMLASVALAALSSARNQAKLAAVKQEMLQMRSILQMSYSDTAGYGNLFSNSTSGNLNVYWITTQSNCVESYGPTSNDAGADATNAAQMLTICKKMMSLINPSNTSYSLPLVNNLLLIGTGGASIKTYSISIYTNIGNSPIYCVGSSGTKFGAINMNDPGCYLNP